MNFLRTTLELPLKESLPQVVNQVEIGGWKDFAEIIAIASSDIQMGLIGLLLDLPNLLLLSRTGNDVLATRHKSAFNFLQR